MRAAAALAALLALAAAALGAADAARSLPGALRETRGATAQLSGTVRNHTATLEQQQERYLNRCYSGVEPLKVRRDFLAEEMGRLTEALQGHRARLQALPGQLNQTETLAQELNATIASIAAKRARVDHLRASEVAEFKHNALRARQLLEMVRTVIFRIDTALGLQRGEPVHEYGEEYGGRVAVRKNGTSEGGGGSFKPRSARETEYGGSRLKDAGEGATAAASPAPAATSATANGGSGAAASATASVKDMVAEIHQLYAAQVKEASRLEGAERDGGRLTTMMETAARGVSDAGRFLGGGISEDGLERLRWALRTLEAEVRQYVRDLGRSERRERRAHERVLALLAEEEAGPARHLAEETERMADLNQALAAATRANAHDDASLRNVTRDLAEVRAALEPMEGHCLRRKAHYTDERLRLAEAQRTINAIVRVLDQHDHGVEIPDERNETEADKDAAEAARKAAANPCAGNPCAAGTVCVATPSNCGGAAGNSSSSSEEGGDIDARPCPLFRCDPTPEPGPNPCLRRNPCPANTICVARVREGECRSEPCEEEEYACEPKLGKHEVRGNETKPATCAAHQQRLREMGILARSGVYILTDPRDRVSFPAFCDMTTNGGGWMLAFKQTSFSSGSLEHSDDFRGAASLLSADHTSFSTKGLTDYGEPEQMLFRAGSKSPDNWFATPALGKYQFWGQGPARRYCLYRPLHKTTFFRSPTWNDAEVSLWDDVDVELMGEFVPSISAITVGRFHDMQIGPECAAPHCSEYRNGRYNGDCQDGAAGEGNWLVYVR